MGQRACAKAMERCLVKRLDLDSGKFGCKPIALQKRSFAFGLCSIPQI